MSISSRFHLLSSKHQDAAASTASTAEAEASTLTSTSSSNAACGGLGRMGKFVRSKLAMCVTALCATLLLPACNSNDIAQSFKELTGISLTNHDIELKKQYLYSAYVFEDFVPAIAHYYAFNRTTFAVYTDEQASDMVAKQYEALADVLQQNGAAVCRTAASCDGRATNITTSLINAEDGALRFINVATDKLNLTRMYSSRGESLGPMSVLAQKRALYRSKLTKPNAYRPAQDFDAILAEQELAAARARTLAETQDVFIDDNAAATANITTDTAAASSQRKATRAKANNKARRAKTASAKPAKSPAVSQTAAVAQPAEKQSTPAASASATATASAKQTAQVTALNAAQSAAQVTALNAAQSAAQIAGAKPAPDPKATASTAATAAKPDTAQQSVYSTVKQFPFFQGFSLLSDANAGELDDLKEMAAQAEVEVESSSLANADETEMRPNPKSLTNKTMYDSIYLKKLSNMRRSSDVFADIILSHCDTTSPLVQVIIEAVNFKSLAHFNAAAVNPEAITASKCTDQACLDYVKEIAHNVEKRQQCEKDWTFNRKLFERPYNNVLSDNYKPSNPAAETTTTSGSDALAFVAYGDDTGRKAVC